MFPSSNGLSVSEYPVSIQVFISCSHTHKDETLCDELKKHLSLSGRSGLLMMWDIRKIAAGMDQNQQIDIQIKIADIILLLLSPDFIASDSCYEQEMKLALKHRENTGVRVIPILLHPLNLEGIPLEEFLLLPRNEEGNVIPIASWKNQDEALSRVAEIIQHEARILRSEKVRNRWVQEGECQTEAGEYSKAEKAYAEALRLFPHHTENGIIYQRRADLLRRLGPACYKDAVEMYTAALNLGSLEASAYHHFGDVLVGISDYKLALNAYELAARADPQNIQLLQKQGDMFSKLGQYDKALTLYNKALEIDSTQVILYLSKGYVLRCLHRYENAFDAYKEALEYDPANAVLWVLKGTALCEMKDYGSAIEAYEHALTIDPTSALAYYGKIFALMRKSITAQFLRQQSYEDAKLFGFSDLFQHEKLSPIDTRFLYCSKKHENWYGARFCNECREELQSRSIFPCPDCGLPVRTNDKYCSNCRHAFTGSLLM